MVFIQICFVHTFLDMGVVIASGIFFKTNLLATIEYWGNWEKRTGGLGTCSYPVGLLTEGFEAMEYARISLI